MTYLIGIIVCVVDADTFDVNVQQYGGPYATSIRGTERVRMVNREVNALRPSFNTPYQQQSLIGMKIHCEIHSRGMDQSLVVTARPVQAGQYGR